MSLCSLTIFILDKTLTYHHNEFKKSHHMSSNWFAHITAHKKWTKNLILFSDWCDCKGWPSYSPFLRENGVVFDFLLKLPVQLHLLSFQSIARRFKLPNDLRKKNLDIDVVIQASAQGREAFWKNSDCINFKNVILCNGRSHCSLKIHIYYIDWWKWTVLFWCIHAQYVHLTYVACKTLVLHLNNI